MMDLHGLAAFLGVQPWSLMSPAAFKRLVKLPYEQGSAAAREYVFGLLQSLMWRHEKSDPEVAASRFP